MIRTALLAGFLIFASFQPLNAQWSETGLRLSEFSMSDNYFEPDNSGGVWILYENHSMSSPRPKVQHIDSNGYKLLGPEGMFVMEDTLAKGYIYGIQPLPDGGAIAIYDYWTADGTLDQVWAQRFSSTGERQFDSAGVKITNATWDVYRGFENGSNVCGDGTDGVWAVFARAFSEDLYFTGMNGDGSLKIDYQYITTMDQAYGSICEDDRGGFYLVTNCPLDDYDESAFYNHFDSTGTPVYEGRGRRLFSELSYSITKVDALPYSGGGIIVAGGDADGIGWFQRVAPNDTLVWGSTGVHYLLEAIRFSFPPAIKADGSMIFAGVADAAYDYRVRFGWISDEGEELVPFTSNIISHGDATVRHRWPGIASIYDDDEYQIVILDRDFEAEENGLEYHCTVNRISSDGTSDLWSENPPRVGALPTEYVYNAFFSVPLMDNTALVVIGCRETPASNTVFHLYKIDPVELQLSVGDDAPANLLQPNRIEIVSTYPNPFNSSVALAVNLPVSGVFTVEVYDITGRLVDTIQQSATRAGAAKIIWSPNSTLSSGVYFLLVTQVKWVSQVTKTVLLQ